jgi:hypothetical protein
LRDGKAQKMVGGGVTGSGRYCRGNFQKENKKRRYIFGANLFVFVCVCESTVYYCYC